MHMNRFLPSIIVLNLLLLPVYLSAQALSREHNTPQHTDSLLAYKLPYVAATDSGSNCIWDFSGISIDSAAIIEVNYFTPLADTASIGLHREHTNYYYRCIHDTLWLTGYETSRTHVYYFSALPLLRFPFEYGDTLSGCFSGEGQYCHFLPFQVDGCISTYVAAMGRLILPDIAIDTVLFVRSHMIYRENGDTQSCVREERYCWYSAYCRYPLLESVHMQTVKNSDTVSFASSYYFPQEQIDIPNPKQKRQDTLSNVMENLVTDVVYMPNPIYADLQVHYSLARSAQVYISLHYNGGVTTSQTPVHCEEKGHHAVSVDMSGLPVGNYVVYIHADDTIVAGNIIKF